MGDYLALIRKICSTHYGSGKLILISQLYNRIDNIAREMCTLFKYHESEYTVQCQDCGFAVRERSNFSYKMTVCFQCGSIRNQKFNFKFEVWDFPNVDSYLMWKSGFVGSKGNRPYLKHYFKYGLEEYFGIYDTYQMDELVSSMY